MSLVRMKSFGWALIHHDQCPYKKREDNGKTDTQGEDAGTQRHRGKTAMARWKQRLE